MTATYNSLFKLARIVGAALVLALIAIVAANIVFREGFGIALVWANEVAVVLFVWIAFIGAGVSFADNARIRFTFISDMLPRVANTTIEVVVSYTGLVLLAGLFATSLYVTYTHRQQTFATLPISVVWEWMSVPTGTLLAILGWLRHGKWTPAQARAGSGPQGLGN